MFERSAFAWCGCGKGEHLRIDLGVSFWSPSLSDETKSDIRYLFQRLFKTEWGDWDNDELCPNGIHDVDKIAKIEFVKSLPKTLVFRPYGAIANTNIPPRCMYPERLQVQDSEGVKTYLLVAVLNHHGATNQGGHFTAKIRLSDGNWLHADDYSVSSTTIHPLTDGKLLS